MAEEDKNQAKNENRIKKKTSNFFIQELEEKEKIKKQSNLFKKAVDDEKARKLQLIEEESEARQNAVSDKISKLEGALKMDDSELIKEILKNTKI